MAWPGYPDSFDPGWWRVNVVTPPYFSGTGTTSSGSAAVTGFAASYQGAAVTPLAGQQVSGTGIPAGTVILATPAPTASGFTMSADATASGTGTIAVGAEPASLAEAKKWARVTTTDDDDLVQDIITAARELAEGPDLKRAVMLQGRCIYFMGFPWTGGYYNRLIRSMGPNPWWLPTAQGIILLPYPPLQAVTSIQYIDPSSGDLLTIDPSKYLFTANSTPGRVQPQYGAVWPLARPVIDAVRITYACGYGASTGDVPASVRLAIRSAVASSYENREAFLEGGVLAAAPMFERFLNAEQWGSYQ